MQQAEIDAPLNKARAALNADTWEREYQTGRNMTVEDALTEVHAADATS